jgi:hypothetical protein
MLSVNHGQSEVLPQFEIRWAIKMRSTFVKLRRRVFRDRKAFRQSILRRKAGKWAAPFPARFRLSGLRLFVSRRYAPPRSSVPNCKNPTTYFGVWSASKIQRASELLTTLGVRYNVVQVHADQNVLEEWCAWDVAAKGAQYRVSPVDLDSRSSEGRVKNC